MVLRAVTTITFNEHRIRIRKEDTRHCGGDVLAMPWLVFLFQQRTGQGLVLRGDGLEHIFWRFLVDFAHSSGVYPRSKV